MIHLDDLRLRKTYTFLYKKLPKRYHQLKDDKFKIPFRYPYKFRFIFYLISNIMQKINLSPKVKKRIYDFPNDFIEDEKLIIWFKSMLKDEEYSSFFNQDYLDLIFNDERLLCKNYEFLKRSVCFILLLSNFKNIELSKNVM